MILIAMENSDEYMTDTHITGSPSSNPNTDTAGPTTTEEPPKIGEIRGPLRNMYIIYLKNNSVIICPNYWNFSTAYKERLIANQSYDKIKNELQNPNTRQGSYEIKDGMLTGLSLNTFEDQNKHIIFIKHDYTPLNIKNNQ